MFNYRAMYSQPLAVDVNHAKATKASDLSGSYSLLITVSLVALGGLSFVEKILSLDVPMNTAGNRLNTIC